MKFTADAKCEYCGARRNDGALRIDITGLGMYSHLPTYPIRIPTHYVACKNRDCLAKDLDKMRDDLLSKFPKNQSNAVGPVSRGSPGCAFNDPPDVSKKDPNGC